MIMTEKLDILYFIASSVPTEEELADAATYGVVKFRNSAFLREEESVEDCHAVAGIILYGYKDLPKATPLGEAVEAAPAAPEVVKPVAVAPEAPVVAAAPAKVEEVLAPVDPVIPPEAPAAAGWDGVIIP
jgi:hypothetical protein